MRRATAISSQRLAACRDDGQAQAASLWFSVAHNALRPWPWILVGLAALVIYPQLPGTGADRLTASLSTDLGGGREVPQVAPASLDVATGGTLTFSGLGADCTARVGGQEAAIEGSPNGRGHRPLYHFRRLRCFRSRSLLPLRRSRTHAAPSSVPRPARRAGGPGDGLSPDHGPHSAQRPAGPGGGEPAGGVHEHHRHPHQFGGASYLVQDLYRRFVRPEAAEKHYVTVSRLSHSADGDFGPACQPCSFGISPPSGDSSSPSGAGLGSVSAARWYWPRVTPYAEFAALGVTTLLGVGLEVFATPTLFGGPNPWFLAEVAGWAKIVIIAGASLACWVPVALWGPANDDAVLRRFAAKVRPPGPAWAAYRSGAPEPMGPLALRFLAGAGVVFCTLFGLGEVVLGSPLLGWGLVAAAALFLAWILKPAPSPHSSPVWGIIPR